LPAQVKLLLGYSRAPFQAFDARLALPTYFLLVAYSSTLKVETVSSYILEGFTLYSNALENLKSNISFSVRFVFVNVKLYMVFSLL
jgi:hypothetical protein